MYGITVMGWTAPGTGGVTEQEGLGDSLHCPFAYAATYFGG